MPKKNFLSRWWLEVTSCCERASASSRSAASARPSISLALLLMLVPVWVVLMPSALHANTIIVNTTNDPGNSSECSLRAAINNANNETADANSTCAAGTGTDTIVFSVSGTITLGSDGTLPAIQNTLTIDGSGKTITIDGAHGFGVLEMNSGATLNLNDLTIANGNTGPNGSEPGAGVDNLGGKLTVTNSTFSGNSADTGGGGGIYNNGTLIVTNSTFFGNGAFDGGAIENDNTATVTNSTFFDNGAFNGGAIDNNGTATVSNSILADGTSRGNCSGGITDGGYNISDDNTCGFTGTGANGKPIGDSVSDAHLALGSLANNGGPTETIALESGSYAIDAVPIALCPATDQRGAPRPDPGTPPETACDIGAFESGNVGEVWIAPSAINFGTVAIGESSPPSTVTLTNGSGETLRLIEWSLGPDFKIASTTCAQPPSDLPTSESCTVTIVFHPLSGGSKNELFQVHNSSLENPLIVRLRGVAKGH